MSEVDLAEIALRGFDCAADQAASDGGRCCRQLGRI
jgi:hypothetical protein